MFPFEKGGRTESIRVVIIQIRFFPLNHISLLSYPEFWPEISLPILVNLYGKNSSGRQADLSIDVIRYHYS